jgi:uncharacterized phage infection (PIP) family protein YhgE
MSERWIMSGFVAVLVLSCCAASAQAPQQSPPPSTSIQEQTTVPPLKMDELRDFLQEQLKAIESLQEKTGQSFRNAAEADQRFDETIKAYRDLIDRFGSGSKQIEQMEAFAKQMDQWASEAASSPIKARQEMAQEYRAIASEVRSLRAGFVEQSDLADKNIRQLQELREVAIDDIRLNAGRRIVDGLKAQYEIMKTTNEKAQQAVEVFKEKMKGRGLGY